MRSVSNYIPTPNKLVVGRIQMSSYSVLIIIKVCWLTRRCILAFTKVPITSNVTGTYFLLIQLSLGGTSASMTYDAVLLFII